MKKESKFESVIIVLLLISSILILIKQNVFINYIGYGSTIVLILICFIRVIKQKIHIGFISWSLIAFVGYNIIILIREFSLSSLYIVMQEIALLLFLFVVMNLNLKEEINKKHIKFFSKLYYIALIFIFIINLAGKQEQFEEIISMTVYKVIFAISFFAFSTSKRKLILTVLSGVVFFMIGERTCAIIFLFMYIVNIIINSLKNRKIYKIIFISFSIILIMIPRIYVLIQYEPIGQKLNEYSRELSGENFFSGRNTIWGVIFESLEGNETFGLTYDNDVLISNSITVSTHNLYIWLQLNGGYILLILFIILMYAIWMEYYKKIEVKEVKWLATYLLGFMLLANFELIWLSNNFAVSMYMWFVIGTGLANVKKWKEDLVQKEL